jgi:hypothetical protein
MKPQFWRIARRLHNGAIARPSVIVFRAHLQVFVPFAKKDARLGWGANQDAPELVWSLRK